MLSVVNMVKSRPPTGQATDSTQRRPGKSISADNGNVFSRLR